MVSKEVTSREDTKVIDLESTTYVLQRRDPDAFKWEAHGMHIKGKSNAWKVLRQTRNEAPDWEWQVTPKSVYDRYCAGYKDGFEAAKKLFMRNEEP